MVVGNDKKFVSAVILPAFEGLQQWCENEGIAYTSNAEIIKNPKVRTYYDALIKRLNPNFSKVEQIKKFELVSDSWTVESGHLTPTMKLKRREVLKSYDELIKGIYRG